MAGKRGKCTQCGKGPRKLVNGICQHECVGLNKKANEEISRPQSGKQCCSCKQSEGTGPKLNWAICSNPKCGNCFHAVCTDLGELSTKALAAVYWICPACSLILKPVWVSKDSEAAVPSHSSAPSLEQITSVMENLVKQVVPNLVEDALAKHIPKVQHVQESSTLRSLQECERQKRRCNIIIKGVEESNSEVSEERQKHDEVLFSSLSTKIGLQEMPIKVTRLGKLNHDLNSLHNDQGSSSQNCRPMRVSFCREDPVVHLLTAKNVTHNGKVLWFNRDLTKQERDLEFQARNKRRERRKQGSASSSSSTSLQANSDQQRQ